MDFKVHFTSESDSAYFRIPLANFVSNTEIPNQCVLYVEYLNSDSAESQQVIFGGMFFQSIYAQFELSGVNAVQATLYVNQNALTGTYLGSAVVPDGPNVFDVQPLMLQTDNQTERNGLPTFTASLAGITDAHPYYMIDLTNDHSVFWNTACMQSGSLGSGSCELTPTLMSTGFDAANNSSGLIRQEGVFTNAKFGGYVVSGTKYTSQFCLESGRCKDIIAYSGESVSSDSWLYDLDGTYGVIGLGPMSRLWTGFTDPYSLTSNYSISLGRISAQGLIPQSNITLGGASVAEYTGAKYSNISAQPNYSYGLNNFSFGIVYQTDGIDTSEYFYELQNNYSAIFTTNFVGLGLPADVWESVIALIDTVSQGTAMCANTPDGVCYLS
jgi:hypothetical protein